MLHLELLKMRIGFSLILALFSVSFSAAEPADAGGYYCGSHGRYASKISPKVFIISMFEPEAAVWWGIDEFDILANNISVTGFSPLFPDAHCTNDGDICQIIVGEGGTCMSIAKTLPLYSSSEDILSFSSFSEHLRNLNFKHFDRKGLFEISEE